MGVLSPKLFKSGATVLRSCSSSVVVFAVRYVLLVGLKMLELPLLPLLLPAIPDTREMVSFEVSIFTLTNGSDEDREKDKDRVLGSI